VGACLPTSPAAKLDGWDLEGVKVMCGSCPIDIVTSRDSAILLYGRRFPFDWRSSRHQHTLPASRRVVKGTW